MKKGRHDTIDGKDTKDGAKAQKLKKEATSSKGRHMQPKGKDVSKKPTKMAKMESNGNDSKASMKEMMF